jgi:YHS domain-containing protein
MKNYLILCFVFLLVHTQDVFAQKSAVFIKNGKAIDGYDVVDFHLSKKATKGDDAFVTKWNGAEWYFSNAQNLNLFVASPEKYAPAFGGYCAYGLSQGHKAPTIVDTWTILKDTLYFNYNLKVKERWLVKTDSLIQVGQKNWASIKDKD